MLRIHHAELYVHIPIDSEIRNDPRFIRVAKALGSEPEALFLCFVAWSLARRYWQVEHTYIPFDVWDAGDFGPLEEAKLAERREGGVYCRGTVDSFDWYHEWKADKSAAGKASAAVRRAKFGTAQPQKPRTDAEQTSNSLEQARTDSNVTITITPTIKEKKRESPSAPPASLLLEIWTAHHGSLPAVRALTGKRADKARARFAEMPDPAYWTEVIRRLAASSFATGKNDRQWRADFDWLVANDTNHVKVAEGKYDDRGKGAASSSSSPGYTVLTEKDLHEL